MTINKPKLLIIGHARHGKDTLAECFAKHGYTFQSSSEAAAEIFLFDKLKDKYGYETFEECFEDRINHRAEWFDEIKEYNSSDRARLAKKIMERSDIYVGMRSSEEIRECRRQGVFDVVIWVENKRKSEEEESSFDIKREDADVVCTNNGTIEELQQKVDIFVEAHGAWNKFEANWEIL